ncbi:hypothetical protein C3L33_19376, partial [Rhododendron williamsianum]
MYSNLFTITDLFFFFAFSRWYNSLPPVTKAYGTLCLIFTTANQFGLYHPAYIALIYERVFKHLEVNFHLRDLLVEEALSAIPGLWSPFLGVSLVFMLLYVWSREFPNANISIYGLVTLKAFYLPWAMLGMDVIFGSPLLPDLLGIIAGHLYYFLTVLHPLAGGRTILKTPIHKLVARLGIGAPATAQAQPDRNTGGAFRGRSYRVGG